MKPIQIEYIYIYIYIYMCVCVCVFMCVYIYICSFLFCRQVDSEAPVSWILVKINKCSGLKVVKLKGNRGTEN
jgi:hypothetical protein